ncbi:hypothetical protein [Pseudomonas juntendi]|nr:hypothetical protein [Pseudomonas juntendi]UJM15213.1 hypothetical protein L1P09_26130 [Pseudomonas juntendi]
MGKRFASDLSRIIRKAGANMDAVAALTCQDLGQLVVEGTPVDTGFARGSWQPSLNSGTTTGTGEPLSQLALVTAQMQAGDRFFFLNNTRYILRLEYGWSQQAPNGMVRIALAQAKAIAEGHARRLRGK